MRFIRLSAAALGLILLGTAAPAMTQPTSAAWTDQVHFAAPVTSGTWNTVPPAGRAQLTFYGQPRFEYPSEKTLTFHGMIGNQVTSGPGQPVTDLTIRLSVPAALPLNVQKIESSANWALGAGPVVVGGAKIFEFTYVGAPIPVYGGTDAFKATFTVPCGRGDAGKAFSTITTVSSPQANASISAAGTITIPSYWNGCKP
ncbi:MAG: hypothetical protein ABI255_08405 [Microbacteriaceae bacterium]